MEMLILVWVSSVQLWHTGLTDNKDNSWLVLANLSCQNGFSNTLILVYNITEPLRSMETYTSDWEHKEETEGTLKYSGFLASSWINVIL